uniref:CPG4 domain-containing protein n=1 Tax=Rhabditophanes sp. KR3021 TaxID=114890 RepID=A0AC35TIC2_9BILA
MDFTDCLKHCAGSGSSSINWHEEVVDKWTGQSVSAIPRYIAKKFPWFKLLMKRCKRFVKKESPNFYCISKYRNFMSVKCSEFLNEAAFQHKSIKSEKEFMESCRYIHYHQNCLSNSVKEYCPRGRKLFNTHTLRKYFLSFMVPDNDMRFDDQFLDNCNLKETDFDEVLIDEDQITSTTNSKLATPSPKHTTTRRSVFLSTESFELIPPNFVEHSPGSYYILTKRPPNHPTPNTLPPKEVNLPEDTPHNQVPTYQISDPITPIEYEIGAPATIINSPPLTTLPTQTEDTNLLPHNRPLLGGKVYIKKILHFGDLQKDNDFEMGEGERLVEFIDVKDNIVDIQNHLFEDEDYMEEEDDGLEGPQQIEPIIGSPYYFPFIVCVIVFVVGATLYILLLCLRTKCNKNVRCGVEL